VLEWRFIDSSSWPFKLRACEGYIYTWWGDLS
jgi:hypothetical protein